MEALARLFYAQGRVRKIVAEAIRAPRGGQGEETSPIQLVCPGTQRKMSAELTGTRRTSR